MADRPDNQNQVPFAGVGIALGAAIGLIFGMMLLENMILGSVAGAGIGLIIGAAIDAQRRRAA